MRPWGFIGGASLLILAQACGTHQHRRAGMDLDHSQASSTGLFTETVGRLAVDTTALGASDAASVECKKEYDFSPASFDRVLVKVLRETGGFRSVGLRAPTEDDGDLLLDGEPDLLLRMELETQSLTFRERNSSNLWGIILWLLPPCVEAQWIHDEDYGLQFRGRGLILHPETEEVIQEVDLGECAAVDSLNFHERTSSIGPYLLTFFIPPTAVSSDPDALLEALLPQAMDGALVRLRDGFQAVAPGEEGRGIVVEATPSDLLTFEIESPAPGTEVDGDTTDIALDLVFTRDSRNLAEVRINGDVIIRYPNRRHRPIQERIRVEMDGVPFLDGAITVTVTLDSQVEPIEAVIHQR